MTSFPGPARWSIRTKLPLLIGGLIVAVGVALAWSSYREVRRSAIETAEARLRTGASELVADFMQEFANLERALNILASEPPLVAALEQDEIPPPSAVQRIERLIAAEPSALGVEVWARSGRRVFTTGDGPRLETAGITGTPEQPPLLGYTPILTLGDTVFFQTTRPVTSGSDTVGLFTYTHRFRGDQGAIARYRALIGGNPRLLMGSAINDVWYDLHGAVASVPIQQSDTGLVRYEHDGAPYRAMLSPIPGTPWSAVVEFSDDSVLAGSRAFLRRLLLAGGFVTVIGIAGGWWMSRQITIPLASLTTAVQEFAGGNYTSRVANDRRDEIGRVAAAFNTMALKVGEHQAALVRANATLRESEERFELVAQGTLDGLWDWRIAAGTTFYSPRFCELLELRDTTDDFLQTLRAHTHPDDRDTALRAVEAHLARRGLLDLELRFVTARGQLRWFHLRGQALWDEEGRATRLAGSIIDITPRRRAETEVRELNATLERRVEERTAALTDANAELEAFAYSVSHDLRAPLRQANGFAQLLEEDYADRLDDEARHYVRRIRDSATRMGHLVDDLLRLSRVGRQRLTSGSVDLKELVDIVRTDLRSDTTGRTIEWRIAELPTVTGDASLIKQVLVNLLDNAIKYTRPRERAFIEVGSDVGTGETVVHVRDNGVGFDEAYTDKLFGVFQRLHQSDEFEGTGVGLAIVQRIVHRHGGRVWAESPPTGGATFYFSVPVEPPRPTTA